MRIRRYTGKDAQEAILKVKMDLGSEAIILSTRKVRKKGILGFFSKPLTEVLAAIDEDYGTKKEAAEPAKKTKPEMGTYNRMGEAQPVPQPETRVDSLESRVQQMESMLERIYNKVAKNQQDGSEAGNGEKTNGKSIEPKMDLAVDKSRDSEVSRNTQPNTSAQVSEAPETGKDNAAAYNELRKVLFDNEI